MSDLLKTLSVVSVIWIIAAGFLIFILLFLFAKRQIMRFTLKSRRGPYVSIGSDAPKQLRQEIFRRLDRVPEIKHEPKLLNQQMEQLATSGPNHYYFRMRAIDAFSQFDETLRSEVPAACRHPNQTMREYLTTIYPEYLSTAPSELLSQFIDLYEHARHKPEVFEESHFLKYSQMLEDLVLCLMEGIKMKKEANIEQMKNIPLVDTEVKIKSHRIKGKSKTSIPYNHMSSEKYTSKTQTRYRTRASSSEQAGLLESAPSSQRSSVEGLVTAQDCSEESIGLVQVNMNTMPNI
ncbi:hypothetical protein ACF0H5_013106 [Mactra antiquata]